MINNKINTPEGEVGIYITLSDKNNNISPNFEIEYFAVLNDKIITEQDASERMIFAYGYKSLTNEWEASNEDFKLIKQSVLSANEKK